MNTSSLDKLSSLLSSSKGLGVSKEGEEVLGKLVEALKCNAAPTQQVAQSPVQIQNTEQKGCVV